MLQILLALYHDRFRDKEWERFQWTVVSAIQLNLNYEKIIVGWARDWQNTRENKELILPDIDYTLWQKFRLQNNEVKN